jgi:hypothetical protein
VTSGAQPAVAAFVDGLQLYLNPDLTSMIEAETGGQRAENAKWIVALLDTSLQSETEAVLDLGDSAIADLEAALDRYEKENEFIGLAILAVLTRIRGEQGSGS